MRLSKWWPSPGGRRAAPLHAEQENRPRAGSEVKRRYGITIQQVKLKDTAEAVTRLIAKKSAGCDANGSVDLIWINGPNFPAMKSQGLLHGPITQSLPHYRYVDTEHKQSNLIDFTVPIDSMAAPWCLAQFVCICDNARHKLADMPTSAPALLAFAHQHPGRVTHPTVRNFLWATFLKQALCDLLPDASRVAAASDRCQLGTDNGPLWVWYDELRPTLWRSGREFPEIGPAERQLMNDGAIDIHMAFDPAWGGNMTVLDLAKVPAAERGLFAPKVGMPGLPTNEELGSPLLESHPSRMTRITAQWEKRYSR